MPKQTDFRMAPGSTPPADLCADAQQAWESWRAYALSYKPSNPREFGGGHIMDSRTSHETRRHDWIVKGRLQLDLVEKICRGGRGRTCTTDCTNRIRIEEDTAL